MSSNALIIRGKRVELGDIAGCPTIRNFVDYPEMALDSSDRRKRTTTWIRADVVHTTKGVKGGVVRPGRASSIRDNAAKVVRYWSHSDKRAGAQIVIDNDAELIQTCDLWDSVAFHAGVVNEYTNGTELYQEEDGDLYEDQLDVFVWYSDVRTWLLQQQRQINSHYDGRPDEFLMDAPGSIVGVYGHRDCSSNRGRGDPTDFPYQYLARAGYLDAPWALHAESWRLRQRALGIPPDGIPGPRTVAALQRNYEPGASQPWHLPRGLFLARPVDAALAQRFGNDWRP